MESIEALFYGTIGTHVCCQSTTTPDTGDSMEGIDLSNHGTNGRYGRKHGRNRPVILRHQRKAFYSTNEK